MSDSKAIFIVLASGSGERFGGYKPAARVNGRPMLYWSMANIKSQRQWISRVIVAVPSLAQWRQLKRLGAIPRGLPWPVEVVLGGSTRFISLQNCLQSIDSPGGSRPVVRQPVFVHDAARPSWPAAWIAGMLRLLRSDAKASVVVPLLPVRETIKVVNGRIETFDKREQLRISQTPQLFYLSDYRRALSSDRQRRSFLDESQVFEQAGMKVLPFDGFAGNIKVTYPQDIGFIKRVYRF